MTALLLVLTFVLSIFMIVQFALRETISGQDQELDNLSQQISGLADALGLEQRKVGELSADLSQTRLSLLTANDDLATSQAALEAAQNDIAEQFAIIQGLIADSNRQQDQIAALEQANQAELSAKEAAQLALAQARREIDVATEQARLAAAKREALEAMVADLNSDLTAQNNALETTEAALNEAEKTRLLEAAAAAALRERLANSTDELTAMELALEAKRKEAEDTLTLLAAAEAAKASLEQDFSTELNEREKQALLLSQANALLDQEKAASAEAQRQVTLLNAQTVELRKQLNLLQGLIDTAEAKDIEAQVQLETLGRNLNAALARVASEEKKRAALEEAERLRLEKEAANLEKFKSEFFGRVREILEGREGVRIVGDRFVFSSEVLFSAGSAELGAAGQFEIRKIAGIINQLADQIPSEIDWILRVDGHTDRVPLTGNGQYADNWELSQARALSVVKYLSNRLGIPPNRLAANGFGEFQPIDPADTPAAYATNRRIELKFTEK